MTKQANKCLIRLAGKAAAALPAIAECAFWCCLKFSTQDCQKTYWGTVAAKGIMVSKREN